MQRTTPQLKQLAQFYFNTDAGSKLAKLLGLNAEEALKQLDGVDGPMYRRTISSKQPMCAITEKGKIVYSEKDREQAYLDEMSSTGIASSGWSYVFIKDFYSLTLLIDIGEGASNQALLDAADTLSSLMSVAASKSGDAILKKRLDEILGKLGSQTVCCFFCLIIRSYPFT